MSAAAPDAPLRQRVEALGSALAGSLERALAELPRRAVGPQRLADALGITVVTASRLLKGISQRDPIAALQTLPGPKPLRAIVAAVRRAGVRPETCDAALAAVVEFETLIREEAGDRRSLAAMLTAWLPEERREFEAQRRQAIFKASAELRGISCDLMSTTLLLNVSREDPARLDLVVVESLLGVHRIRPDAAVGLSTRRMPKARAEGPGASGPRIPTSLDGRPALEGPSATRLDAFCIAPPAPLEVELFGNTVHYTLGPTGLGPSSAVDLVLAEVNRGELLRENTDAAGRKAHFFSYPELPSALLVFDLVLHRDVYPDCAVELQVYDTSARGPAVPGDPARRLDLRTTSDAVESVPNGLRGLRLLEFPRYVELLEHACSELDWDPGALRAWRVRVPYPLLTQQLTLVVRGSGPGSG